MRSPPVARHLRMPFTPAPVGASRRYSRCIPVLVFSILHPAGIRLSPAPPRKPINRSKEKNHGDHQPRVPWCNSHRPEYNNVSCRHQQRRNRDNQKRAIHGLTIFPIRYDPGRYCARLVSVSHKMTSVTRAPGGRSFNCLATSS